MAITTGAIIKTKKHKEVLKKQYVVSPPSHPTPPPFSPSLSRAAYYSVLIYKALNVILHVQVKGREWKRKRRKRREGKERDGKRGKRERRLETDRERKRGPRHGEVTARHFQSRTGTQKGNCFSPDVAFAQQAGYNVPTELMSPISEMIKNWFCPCNYSM